MKRKDDKEVTVNIYGYPICPMPHLHENEDKASDFLENTGNNDPDLVLV